MELIESIATDSPICASLPSVQHPPVEPSALAAVSELALLIAALDGVPDRLLHAHIARPDGYRRGCHLPQSGPVRWPCTLRVLAEKAGTVRRARPDSGP